MARKPAPKPKGEIDYDVGGNEIQPITAEESFVRPFEPLQTIPTATAPQEGRSNFATGYHPQVYQPPATRDAGLTNTNQVSDYGSGMDTWRYGSPADERKKKLQNQSGGGVISTGGGQDQQAKGTKTTSTTTFTGEKPTAPKLPELKMPQVNKRTIAALQQKHAGPGIRRLREMMQQSLAQTSDNPNVRRMTIREALQGYGTGLESVMAGAYGTARSEHMADIQQQSHEAQLEWQAEINRQNQLYQAAINEYMAGATKTTVTGPDEDIPALPENNLRAAYEKIIPFGTGRAF